MQFESSRRRLVVVVAAGALLTGACGGEDLIESGMEQAIERAAESEGGSDVDLDLDLDLDGDGGSFTMEIDGAEAQMGSNLAVPDWVPDGFPLPDDFDISMTVVEDGTSVLSGGSNAASDAFHDEVVGWLEGNGYEILRDTTGEDRFDFVAVRGDDVLEGNHGMGGFTLTSSRRDVTFERQEAATVREGSGTATASVGAIDTSFEGTCRIQGEDYTFEAMTPEATANLSVYAVGDQPPQGSAFVMTADVETSEFIQYSINFPMGNDDEPQVSTGDASFGVTGTWFDMLGGEPLQGTLEVTCDL